MSQVGDILNFSHDILHKMKQILEALEEIDTSGSQNANHNVSMAKQRILDTAHAGVSYCSEILEKYTSDRVTAQEDKTEIYVAEFLQTITDDLKKHYGDAVKFSIHCVPSLSEWVCEKRLHRVLFTLLKNAADASISNQATGVVSIYAHHRSGALKIDVRDTGPGLDERVIRQFAERASEVQVDDVATAHGDGLPTVFALAHQMGGRLALERTGSDGSAFRLSVPSRVAIKAKDRIMGLA